MKNLFIVLLVSFTMLGCKARTTNSEQEKRTDEVTVNENQVPLDVYLKRLPGISVRGTGSQATVRIRGGSNSFLLSNEPLFVIDGVIMGGGYPTIYGMINTADIKSIRVVKDIGEMTRYGSRGSNGIIEITMKVK